MQERKKLSILQTNSQDRLTFHGGKLVIESPISKLARKRKNDENCSPIKSLRKDGIYEDPSTTQMNKRSKTFHDVVASDVAVQTELPPMYHQCGSASCNLVPDKETVKKNIIVSVGKCHNKNGTTLKEGIDPNKANDVTDKKSSRGSAGKQADSAARQEDDAQAQAVIDMLTSDAPSEHYWQMVASERKTALTSSLSENKKLHTWSLHLQQQVHLLSDEVHTLNGEVKHLKEENSLLEEMLTEAKQLAQLVADATGVDSELAS